MKQFNNLYIFCDGGARGNPGPSAIGFLIKDNKGKILVQKGKYIGRATNNVAEYQGVIHALRWLIENNLTMKQFNPGKTEDPRLKHRDNEAIDFYLDSQLVVNQLNGLWKIKDAKLRSLVIQVKALENEIKASIIYQHIPREKNKEADKLVNRAIDAHS